jgi:hypothetical protein
MAEHGGYKHNASDKKLDHAADAANESTKTTDTQHSSGATHHDEKKIRQHDDDGKDRLFEHREQHDDAEKKSEKTRLAKDVAQHHHEHNADGTVTDAGTDESTKHQD